MNKIKINQLQMMKTFTVKMKKQTKIKEMVKKIYKKINRHKSAK